MKNFYESKDWQICPFLLVQANITFLGTRVSEGVVFFQFSPQNRCVELVNDFLTRKAPLCQPIDLLNAVENYKRIIHDAKNGLLDDLEIRRST
ncbi:MAG: hypothetical protein M1484_03040 [Patescibacteria group bacterium]|nr:hypothetical protein [Patescibacteria group bacterium]MCL5432048.1 hypothetical protein [Patescibacteria group bacterium]